MTMTGEVDETKPKRDWWLYFLLTATLTAVTGLIAYLIENFSLVKALYGKTLTIVSRLFHNTIYLLTKTPLLGVLTLGLPLMQSWYQAITDGSLTDANKLVRLLFKTMVNTLPLIGYFLCYFAAGVMTVPAVALFIAGAVLDVVEALYTLIYQEIKRYFNPIAPATEFHSASLNARANNTHERNLRIFIVKFTANILATASVVVWCIFPQSLMIALTCFGFSWLLSLTKNWLVSTIKNNYAIALQSEFKDISDRYPSPVNSEDPRLKQQNIDVDGPSDQPTLHDLAAEHRDRNDSHGQNMELKEDNEGFDRRCDPSMRMNFFSKNTASSLSINDASNDDSSNGLDDNINSIGYNSTF